MNIQLMIAEFIFTICFSPSSPAKTYLLETEDSNNNFQNGIAKKNFSKNLKPLENLDCPVKEKSWTGKAFVSKPSSTWEKCGNLCYLQKQHCAGWTWIEKALYEGTCKLYKKLGKLKRTKTKIISGSVLCPVEDCKHHHFETWWDVVSPCFKKRVENKPIDNPELCIPEPQPTMKNKIKKSIQALNHTVYTSNELSMLAKSMYENVPEDYKEYCPGNFDAMIKYLHVVVMITPPFLIDASDYVGVPITTVLLCFLHTHEGRKFFADPTVNENMRSIVEVYAELLNSPDSLAVFNEGQYGYLSKCALDIVADKAVPLTQKEIDGFTSFNDYFIRKLPNMEKIRPIAPGKYVLTAPGDVVVAYNATNIDFENVLYNKNEKYSLLQIFDNKPKIARLFEGGSILQVYYSPLKYHWYHTIASGELVFAKKVPGILYAIDEVNTMLNNNLTKGEQLNPKDKLDRWLELGQDGLLSTEPYLGHVATRCVFVVKNPDIGYIGMVFIGMTEISSCTVVRSKGDQLKKGDELGVFQFGGSSAILVIQKEAVMASRNRDDILQLLKQDMELKTGQKMIDLSPARY